MNTFKRLRKGSIIQDGDQYSDNDGYSWLPTEAAGFTVGHPGRIYRRPSKALDLSTTYPVTKAEQSFWIQEQAPAGNFFDSIGLDPRTTLKDAKRQTRSWAKGNDRKVRLVVRTDVVVLD